MPTYTDPTASVPPPITTTAHLASGERPVLGTWLVLIGGLLAVATAAYLFVAQLQAASQTKRLVSQEATQQQQLDSLKPVADELAADQALSQGLTTLFSQQKRWATVLDSFQRYLYKRIAVTSLTVDDTGKLTLSGNTPSYDDYAKLYASLTSAQVQPYVANVKALSTSKVGSDTAKAGEAAGSVDFSFSMTLQPALLQPSSH